MGADRGRARAGMLHQTGEQLRLCRDQVQQVGRVLGSGGVGRRLQQRDEFLGRVGGCAAVVEGDEVDATAVARPESRQQAQEVRIGLCVRTTEAG